jgi:hypothetical protein
LRDTLLLTAKHLRSTVIPSQIIGWIHKSNVSQVGKLLIIEGGNMAQDVVKALSDGELVQVLTRPSCRLVHKLSATASARRWFGMNTDFNGAAPHYRLN